MDPREYDQMTRLDWLLAERDAHQRTHKFCDCTCDMLWQLDCAIRTEQEK